MYLNLIIYLVFHYKFINFFKSFINLLKYLKVQQHGSLGDKKGMVKGCCQVLGGGVLHYPQIQKFYEPPLMEKIWTLGQNHKVFEAYVFGENITFWWTKFFYYFSRYFIFTGTAYQILVFGAGAKIITIQQTPCGIAPELA